jgi:hypothetical protein
MVKNRPPERQQKDAYDQMIDQDLPADDILGQEIQQYGQDQPGKENAEDQLQGER